MPVFFTKELKDKNEKYINLNGAGIIYPYVANKKQNSVYRIEAVLKTKVNLKKPLNLAVTTYNSETKIIVSSTIDNNNFINTFCEILLYDNVLGEIINLNDTIKINDDYAAVC